MGSHLLLQLILTEDRIRAMKRESSNISILNLLCDHYNIDTKLLRKIEWVNGDLEDVTGLNEICEDVEVVYHCAAMVSFNPYDAKELIKVNEEGTANLVNVANQVGVKRLCHVSSTAAIGQAGGNYETTEDDAWMVGDPHSAYSISKFNAEREVKRAAEEGLNIVIVNPSIIIGPGVLGKSSSAMFSYALKEIGFYSLGANGFVDARDVARAMIQLSKSDIQKDRFLVTGGNHTFREVLEKISEVLHVKKPIYVAGPFLSKIIYWIEKIRSFLTGSRPLLTKEMITSSNLIVSYSNQKIKKAIGFGFTSVDDSIENTGKYYLRHFKKT